MNRRLLVALNWFGAAAVVTLAAPSARIIRTLETWQCSPYDRSPAFDVYAWWR